MTCHCILSACLSILFNILCLCRNVSKFICVVILHVVLSVYFQTGDDHPNIMGQIECCTDEENIYSVMKFCKGEQICKTTPQRNSILELFFYIFLVSCLHLTFLSSPRVSSGGELFDYIDENGPMDETQARIMFKQLIAGMARLSELGT